MFLFNNNPCMIKSIFLLKNNVNNGEGGGNTEDFSVVKNLLQVLVSCIKLMSFSVAFKENN